ncbi:pyridoxal phosphate-dependent decarboxylase family protein [Ostreiculturibacter nitratireducens]|uniref:pyridoxal phosphate-dependent decarboxylase family protein n=1 Tax=Ostreiculturibacter nitratireducens TaxID=3075226 RepID=UPI0031B62460
MENRPEETLDPDDWSLVRDVAHEIVDDAVRHVSGVRDRRVWQEMPEAVRGSFRAPLPVEPTSLGDVYREFRETVLRYPMGNIHPRFWGWYMGAGNFTGALGDFLAAIDGSNLGGGNTAAAEIDRQVVAWLKAMTEFPDSASGTLTSGGSMANMVGLTVARNAMAGIDVRQEGVTSLPQPLRFYTSDQVHSCHQKALETLGLGSRALRLVPSDKDFRMDLSALKSAIEQDRAEGWKPACVIATAGTTNTGSIDDMQAIGDLCRREGLWFHVDGCIGALIKIAPENRHLVDGIETADSLALDPHKWLHAPFEAGCAVVRDAKRHFQTFTLHGDYLEEKPRGVASGEYLFDYGFELSRGFKALKIWLSLKEQGVAKFGRLIDQNIAQGAYLTRLIEAEPGLELMAPTAINIVCFRYRGDMTDETRLRALNTEIMLRLQEAGTAVATDTVVRGRHCLRAAINNHRTRREDLELLVGETLRLGRELEGTFPM